MPVIMVVDDDQDNLNIAKSILEHSGHEVHGFSDPVLALEHLENSCEDCELLVTDVRMPHMNGFQLVRRVRESRPDIKVVMMTAFEMNKPEFEAVFPSMQLENVIRKPFVPSKLAEMIKEICRSEQSKK